jgi:hypothetical protein
MTFQSGWNKPKLNVIPVLGANPTNKQKKQKAYLEKNNQKRIDGKIFLEVFGETDMRNAIQMANSKFNNADGQIKSLLNNMIGSDVLITIDQGTHQAEDVASGGFKLHFDARRPSDNKCFHLYVGQENSGTLILTEVSYMNRAEGVTAYAS